MSDTATPAHLLAPASRSSFLRSRGGLRLRYSGHNLAIALFSVVLVAAVWLLTIERIRFERESAIEEAVRTNDNLVRALEEQTIRTLKQVDQALLYARREYEQGHRIDLHKLISAGEIDGDILTNIGITDARGRLLFDDLSFQPTNLADREYFRALRDGADRLYIAKPVVGRVSGKWSVHVARPLRTADGGFGGVVFAGIDLDYFSTFYREADLGAQGLVVLAGTDGIVRARRSGSDVSIGQDLSALPAFQRSFRARSGSLLAMQRIDQLDGIARYISYRRLRDYPLLVAVGTSEAETLAGFQRAQHLHLLVAMLASMGVSLFALGLMVSLSRQKSALEALTRSEALLQATFDQAAVGIVRITPDGRFLEVNARFCELTGYSAAELLGRPTDEISDPRYKDSTAEFRERLLAGLPEAQQGEMEKAYLRKDGSMLWANVAAALVRNDRGEAEYFVAVIQDVTERRKLQERLVHQSHYDSLTQLPNRLLCQDRLQRAIDQAKRRQWNVGVLFIDLDRFKTVNDSLGHAVGDHLLTQVARRIAGCVRGEDTVGRFGGDEFLVMLADLAEARDAANIAQKIIHVLTQPFAVDGYELFVTASIGIATFPDDGGDVEKLIASADAAMYRAKDNGRNNYCFYTATMNATAAERLAVEHDLRLALERREFLLHFQPKLDIAHGTIVGCEALLRWQRPGNGLVAPAEFVALLEDCGLILPVGEWVIRRACMQLREWVDAGINVVPVAVNLSTTQFHRQDICAVVAQALAESGIDPRLLELEITESAAMADPAESIALLHRLKTQGLKLSIDDFGTGYSSLAYLKRLPLDALKLDRSFVVDLPDDGDSVSIAQAVITLAHSLGLKVIAEGVETEAQFGFLATQGCDQMQGYLFAKPLSADEYARLLRQHQAAAMTTGGRITTAA